MPQKKRKNCAEDVEDCGFRMHVRGVWGGGSIARTPTLSHITNAPQELAKAIVGMKVRQFYKGYGENEDNETIVQCYGIKCCGTFPGHVKEVFLDETKLKNEQGLRVLVQVHYDDGDVDDVYLKQVTAVTRRERAKGDRRKPEMGPVIVEDHLQSHKLVAKVKQVAKEVGIELDESQPDCVRQFVRAIAVREEFLMFMPGAHDLLQMMQKKPRMGGASKEKEHSGTHKATQSRKSEIRKEAPAEDDLVICLEKGKQFEVYLRDPYTFKRIRDPVQGQFCTHMDCFDRESFIISNKRLTVSRVSRLIKVVARVLEVNEGSVEVLETDEVSRFRTGVNAIFVVCRIKCKGQDLDGQRFMTVLKEKSLEFIEWLKERDAHGTTMYDPFPFVPKPGSPEGKGLMAQLKGSDRNHCTIKLSIPVNPVKCPVASCNLDGAEHETKSKVVGVLKPVPAMAELLHKVASNDELQLVVVNERYEIVDAGSAREKKARRQSNGASSASCIPQEDFIDMTDPSFAITKNVYIKTEPGLAPEPQPVTAAAPKPGIFKFTSISQAREANKRNLSNADVGIFSTSAQGSLAAAPSRFSRQSDEEQSTRRNVPPDVMLGQINYFNKEEKYGFIKPEGPWPKEAGKRGIYFNGRRFPQEMVDKMAFGQIVNYRMTEYTRNQFSKVIEAVDVQLLDDRGNVIRFGLGAGRSGQDLVLERETSGDNLGSSSTSRPSSRQEDSVEAVVGNNDARARLPIPTAVFVLLQNGCFIGKASLKFLDESAATDSKNQQLAEWVNDFSRVDIKCTLPESVLPKDTRLSHLAWAQVVCCEGSSKAHGLQSLASELAAAKRLAVSTVRRDSHKRGDLLVFLPEDGNLWKAISGHLGLHAAIDSGDNRSGFLVALYPWSERSEQDISQLKGLQ